MRFFGPIIFTSTLAFFSTSGCGYLPSELAPQKKEKPDHARVVVKQHTVSCSTPTRGFRKVGFDDLYATTGDRDHPFREADDIPVQYDVNAYVWGFDNCVQAGTCKGGDNYWLVGRGPGNEFTTWVVTPQFPRITIQSPCRQRLSVGERYRFSFSGGQLVGFSK